MYEIIESQNVDALREMAVVDGPRFSLAYLDPPFFTGRDQVGPAGSYSDNDQATADSVYQVAAICFAILAEHGSLVVHLDWRLASEIRTRLDRAFGVERFASEIIWSYRRWPSKTSNFQRTHDTLLRYVREPGKQRWNQLYDAPSPSTLATWGTRKQRAKVVEGRRVRSVSTEDESPGVPIGDVWQIPIVAPVAKERTGYPTQKPERLLERLKGRDINQLDWIVENGHLEVAIECAVRLFTKSA